MKRKRLVTWLLSLLIGVSVMSAQQAYLLKGDVTDSSGEPLIGASVVVKGTSNGVTTDIDGNFAINVKKGDQLSFSYVGYTSQTVVVNGQQDLKIILQEDTETLEDVVVIGYGTMKKKDLTGSITQINPDKLADQNPSTVQDVLRGVPGLQIGYDASAKGGGSIQMRGQNSVYSENNHNSPLIVVDGMIFYGELSEINPDDIQQIDVLKDASSTAVYGARAASGVIIVTTKKGKQGKPVINVAANWGLITKSAYRKTFSAAENLRYREDYFKAMTYGVNPETGAYEAYQARDSKGNLVAQPGYYDHYSNAGKYGMTPEAWGLMGTNPEGASLDEIYFRRLYNMSGDVSQDLLDNYLAGNLTDWSDLTFRTGFSQDYNLSMSGATERINYYLSFGYLKNQGARRGDDYNTFRSNMKLTGKITNFLEIGANVSFQNRSDNNNPVSISEDYWNNDQLRNSPYASHKLADGSFNQYPMGTKEKRGYNYDFLRAYEKLERGYTVLNSIITAKVTLPFDITYNFNIAPRYQYFHNRWFTSAELPDAARKDRGVDREWAKWFDWSLNNTINWDHTFADIHRVQVTLMQEAEENKYWQDKIEARNILPSDNLGFHNTSNATLADSKFSTNDTHYTADALMARVFYSYDNRYMLTASVRRDGYCAFGSNHPHAVFPSVAVAWNIANEKFMQPYTTWLNNAKLRLSWGKNGNRSLADPYISLANLDSGAGATMSYLDHNGNPVTELKYLLMSRLANPDLMWEKTTAYNVGLDLDFLDFRIGGTIDFYHKETHDMLINMTLPGFSGFSNIWTNIGQVNNTGVEIAINSKNIITKDFEWNTSVGFSYNKNRIKHVKGQHEIIYDEAGNPVGSREIGDTGNKWYINKPIGEIWDYQVTGIWKTGEAEEAAKYGQRPGDPKVANNYRGDDIVNEDGSVTPVYNDKDKVYLGTTNPPIYWNMRNEFRFWDNLTFSFSLYSYMGHKSLDGTYLNRENSGNLFTYGFSKFKHEYWTPENQSNRFARFEAQGPSGCTSPQRVINRNFVRLDNITLGYTLPQKWTRKACIDRVRLSFSINNVCTIHHGDWVWESDPETGGLATRNYNLGIQVTL